MKKLIISLLFASLFWGCEDFLDVNESVDSDARTTPNFILPAVLGNMAYHHYDQSYHTIFVTQYVSTTSGSSAVNDRWDYRSVNRMSPWRKNYFDAAGNAHLMTQFAEDEGSMNYVGVGKITKAFSFLTSTALFGDMPIRQAFSGIFDPVYDTQDVVYEVVEQWFNEGIEALNQSNAATDRAMGANQDHVYKGDINKWKSFAYASLARMKLHTANFQGGYAQVLQMVDNAKMGWEEPKYVFSASAANDWGKNPMGRGRARPAWDHWANELNAAVHTDFFMSAMNLSGSHDPRLYKLTSPGKNGKYLSIPASEGLGALRIEDFADMYDGYWTSDGSPIIFFTTEELFFIEAEAAFYLPNKDRAYQAYINGITENFKRLELMPVLPAYLASSAVAQSANELMISDIMLQKYIALYMQPETWNDMRRYKYASSAYPQLMYPTKALTEYEGKWLQRLIYDPETEYKYNHKEIERLGAKNLNWVVKPFWMVENSTLGN